MLTQAVILCGGLGTRLGDLTRETPKPLLPVGGRPFLEHLVQEVARFGVEEIVLLAGRFGGKIRDAFDGQRLWGADVRVLVEPVPLGTGGALGFAGDVLRDAFFVLNGDSWIAADLVAAGLQWTTAAQGAPPPVAQMLLRHVPDARRYGSVQYADGRVFGFSEKREGGAPSPDLVNAGVYVLDRSLVAAMAPGREVSLERDVFPELARQGLMAGHVVSAESFFIDIGVPDDYARAQTELPAARRRPALLFDRDTLLLPGQGEGSLSGGLAWRPEAREAVRIANHAGRFVFVLTEGAEAASGPEAGEAAEALRRAMQADLFGIGAHVDAAVDTAQDGAGAIASLLHAWPVDPARSRVVAQDGHRPTAGLEAVRHDGGGLAGIVMELVAD